jgi:hypothetical protein
MARNKQFFAENWSKAPKSNRNIGPISGFEGIVLRYQFMDKTKSGSSIYLRK